MKRFWAKEQEYAVSIWDRFIVTGCQNEANLVAFHELVVIIRHLNGTEPQDCMKTYIAFLRGINVGGKNRLAMRELVATLEGLDLRRVKTYIQSGNIVFQTDSGEGTELAGRIQKAIEEKHGFAPPVLILRPEELASAMTANPFPKGESEPKTLHLYFLAAEVQEPDIATLETIRRDSERYALHGRVFYLHAPEGIGRSKLAARVERALGVPTTARNWRTADAVLTMARELANR